mmetsp:Transcript_1896/g.5024  ORF Transcript_1896/g.5024 Transcript_1896/m.5024 type:complete len:135 (-) Transcript_1896:890-1294(-)
MAHENALSHSETKDGNSPMFQDKLSVTIPVDWQNYSFSTMLKSPLALPSRFSLLGCIHIRLSRGMTFESKSMGSLAAASNMTFAASRVVGLYQTTDHCSMLLQWDDNYASANLPIRFHFRYVQDQLVPDADFPL